MKTLLKPGRCNCGKPGFRLENDHSWSCEQCIKDNAVASELITRAIVQQRDPEHEENRRRRDYKRAGGIWQYMEGDAI